MGIGIPHNHHHHLGESAQKILSQTNASVQQAEQSLNRASGAVELLGDKFQRSLVNSTTSVTGVLSSTNSTIENAVATTNSNATRVVERLENAANNFNSVAQKQLGATRESFDNMSATMQGATRVAQDVTSQGLAAMRPLIQTGQPLDFLAVDCS